MMSQINLQGLSWTEEVLLGKKGHKAHGHTDRWLLVCSIHEEWSYTKMISWLQLRLFHRFACSNQLQLSPGKMVVRWWVMKGNSVWYHCFTHSAPLLTDARPSVTSVTAMYVLKQRHGCNNDSQKLQTSECFLSSSVSDGQSRDVCCKLLSCQVLDHDYSQIYYLIPHFHIFLWLDFNVKQRKTRRPPILCFNVTVKCVSRPGSVLTCSWARPRTPSCCWQVKLVNYSGGKGGENLYCYTTEIILTETFALKCTRVKLLLWSTSDLYIMKSD